MRAVQSPVAQHISNLLYLRHQSPLKLSFSQVKPVICFLPKKIPCCHFLTVCSSYLRNLGMWPESLFFSACTESAVSSFRLIWIQSAESIYPEVNGHRPSSFEEELWRIVSKGDVHAWLCGSAHCRNAYMHNRVERARESRWHYLPLAWDREQQFWSGKWVDSTQTVRAEGD